MSFTKQNLTNGTPGDASQINHAEEQYDAVVADMAAGTIPVKATALTDTIAAARLPTRKASAYLSAKGGDPRTTNGCGPATKLELSTNKIMRVGLPFDPSTQEYVQFSYAMPEGWDGGDITFIPYWTAASGSGTVVWGLQARSIDDNESMDQAFGTAAEVTDTFLVANKVHKGPSGTITPAGTPAGGELLVFQAYRKQGTLAVDALLLGIKLEFNTAYGD
ncbi:MAG: hypothetical protein LLG45_13290 [Actinomycetia bacterium]|nr:hypothetical protein [Actinomycetes bacterium]